MAELTLFWDTEMAAVKPCKTVCIVSEITSVPNVGPQAYVDIHHANRFLCFP